MPPRIWEWCLGRLVPGAYRESVVGDAAEEFVRRASRDGFAAARRWYRRQVARSLLPALRHGVHRASGIWTAMRPGGDGVMMTWMGDFRLAVRALRRRPGFSATVLTTLGLGVGATTALFGVFRAVFLEPLPLPDPDEPVFIMEEAGFGCCGPASGPDYLDWRERHRSLEEPERVYGAYATASTLELLGVAPILGRYLAPEDESTPGPVVLSHALWQRVAGGDRAVWGVVLGLLRVWATSSVVEGMVYGIESSDPLTILAGCLVLTGVAVAASAIPALRAAHVSPVTALRAE